MSFTFTQVEGPDAEKFIAATAGRAKTEIPTEIVEFSKAAELGKVYHLRLESDSATQRVIVKGQINQALKPRELKAVYPRTESKQDLVVVIGKGETKEEAEARIAKAKADKEAKVAAAAAAAAAPAPATPAPTVPETPAVPVAPVVPPSTAGRRPEGRA